MAIYFIMKRQTAKLTKVSTPGGLREVAIQKTVPLRETLCGFRCVSIVIKRQRYRDRGRFYMDYVPNNSICKINWDNRTGLVSAVIP